MLISQLANDRTLFVVVLSIFGLLVGSFLNVVIYRLPIILKRQWVLQSKEYLTEVNEHKFSDLDQKQPRFDLLIPRSTCPHCGTQISALQNIPIASYLLLGGKCRHCKTPISARYPIVEALTAAVFGFSAFMFGVDVLTLGALLFSAMLIAMSGIDLDHKLLPDQLTYILLWSGLLINLIGGFTGLSDAVIGALAGYLSLWSVYWLFKLTTGKEGMGYGDFKLFAALGAWLGWQMLPLIIILAAVTGLVIGGGAMLIRKGDRQIPFGPYLAIAGWLAMFFGAQWVELYLRSMGV